VVAAVTGIVVRVVVRSTLVMEELAQPNHDNSTVGGQVPNHPVSLENLAEGHEGPALISEPPEAYRVDTGLEPVQATPLPWWHAPYQAVRALLETVVPALLIAIGINLFLAQATQVQGQSMEPNLHTAQRLVVEKLTYHFHGPRHGDIVVIDLPQAGPELLIKRVIGLPGETISSKGGQVLIDGEPLQEPYVFNPGGRDITEQVVPPLHVFVMGDNRRSSNDSRNFGPVPIDQIVGRAWLKTLVG
jgi:signal peptidase I